MSDRTLLLLTHASVVLLTIICLVALLVDQAHAEEAPYTPQDTRDVEPVS